MQAKFKSTESRGKWLQRIVLLGAMAATAIALAHTPEADWYPLQKIMTDPSHTPVFGHRLLFVMIAWGAKLAFPLATWRQVYFASQVFAILFAFIATRKWVAYAVGPGAEAESDLVLAVSLIPTFAYFTFYDIAIVGFFSLCFLLLMKEQHLGYLIAYAVGLFNHENLLLLAPIAGVYLWLEGRKRSAIAVCTAQVIIYGLYVLARRIFLPGDSSFDMRLFENLNPITTYYLRSVVLSSAALIFPLAGAAVSFRYAPRILRYCSLLLFAELLVITILFGRFSEARQFDAFFALSVPMMVGAFRIHAGHSTGFVLDDRTGQKEAATTSAGSS